MKFSFYVLLLAAAGHAQTSVPGRNPVKPAAAPANAPAAASAGRGASAASAAASSPKDLKYPPLRTIQPPGMATFTLPNGMKIYLMEDRELPALSGFALVRTGSLFDPPERIGLARLTGMTLRAGGTALKTGEQIDALLETLASSVDSNIAASAGTVSFTALKQNAEATLGVVKELLTQPGFRQDKLDLAKTRLRAAVASRNDNGGTIAHREFAGMIYGKDAPYGWQQEYATLDRVSRDDVRAFYQRYFFPANVMLGLCGDFDTAQMKTLLEKLFGDWTVQKPPVVEFPKVKNAPTPGAFLAEKKDATQTFFAIGQLGGQFNDKDFTALEVMGRILGGGPHSRLAERFRAKLSNADPVSAIWGPEFTHAGLFEISGSAKSVSTYETIKAVQEEVERIRAAEVTEDELQVAKDAALHALIFSCDSKTKLFGRLLMFEYYGYPKDSLQQYQQALESVTRAGVLRAARQTIAANLTVLAVGSPTRFGDPLEKLGGPVARLDLTIPAPGIDAAGSTDASLAEGKQILLKAQAAAGGAEKLAAVKDYTMLADYQIDAAVPNLGGAKLVQTDRWISPTVFRQDSVIPSGRVAAYTDGKIGWISTPQGWGALSGAQRSQVLGDLFRVYYRLLLSDRIEGRTVNAIDANTVQIGDATGQVSSVEFDPGTGLPKRVAYTTSQATGTPIYAEDVYDDFRDVGGIKVPFKITINQGGGRFADVVVNDYKVNTGLKPLEIARRPQ